MAPRLAQGEGELFGLALVHFEVPAGEWTLEPAANPFEAAFLVEQDERADVAVIGAEQVRQDERRVVEVEPSDARVWNAKVGAGHRPQPIT